MFESGWKRRFAFLPITLALTIFAVGAAGFVATVGAPEYSRSTAALADFVFAAPAAQSEQVTAPPPAVVSAALAPETPVVADALAEPATPFAFVASVSAASWVTASGSSGVRALPSPVALPTYEATVEPAAFVPTTPVLDLGQPSTAPARQDSPGPPRQLMTLATATPEPIGSVASKVPRGQDGRGRSQAPAHSKTVDGREASPTPSPAHSKGDGNRETGR